MVLTRSAGSLSVFAALALWLSLATTPARAALFVGRLTSQVLEYNGTTGAFMTAFVGAGSGGLVRPTGLVFGPNGNLFVSSSGAASSQVLEYNGTTGAFVTAFVGTGSGGLFPPSYLVFSPVSVPEPASGVLLGLGGFLLFVIVTWRSV